MAGNSKCEDLKVCVRQGTPVHVCTQCQLDGIPAVAVGYCMVCVEYLCHICYRRHCQPSAMRSHILLNHLEMPDVKIVKTKVKCDEICLEHKGNAIAYFCKTCEMIGCCECMRAVHRNCTGVTYIPDHVKTETLKGKEIYTDSWYNYSSKCPITEVQMVIDKIERYRFGVELKANEARKQVKTFREDVLTALDELEKEMDNKINTISSEDLFMLDMLLKKCNAIQVKFQKLKDAVERGKAGDNKNNLFVSSKIAAKTVKEFEDNKMLEKLKNDLKIRNIKFEPNLKETVGKTIVLGDIIEVPDETKKKDWKIIGKINTNTNEEIEESETSKTYRSYCSISACTVLDNGELVVCDTSNNSVRLCKTEIPASQDVSKVSNVICTVKVCAIPKGVTQVSDDFIAVTLPSAKKIQYIEFVDDNKMEKEVALDVSGECVGIGCLDENLIVTYINPGKVEIMDFNGHVLKSIGSEKNSNFFFLKPLSVACDDTRKLIFISDFDGDSVVAVNLDGKRKMIFKDPGMINPLAVALGKDGLILVAVKWPYSVQMIDRDFLEIETLKVRDDTWGIEYVAYSQVQDSLFYGIGGSIVNVRKIN